MKKYISLLTCSLAVAGLVSCDMEAPSQSSLDAETIYTTPQLAESAVMAALDGYGTNNSYRNRIMRFGAINTDIEWYSGTNYTNRESANLDCANYDTEPANTNLNTGAFWTAMYQGIEKLNTACKYLEQYHGGNSSLSKLYAEALTLRAVMFMDLIKFYGDVPARFQETTNDNIYMPKAPSDSILSVLIDDLGTAEDLMEWSAANYNSQRVTKSFIKGLRARAALWACGYALHDVNGVAQYRKSSREELSEQKMWQLCLDECKDVIANHPAKLQDLPFEQNFRYLCEMENNKNNESLWEIPFGTNRGQLLYAYAPKHTQKDQYSFGSYGGQVCMVPTYMYDFDPQDARRDIVCAPFQWSASETATPEASKITGIYFGKLRYEWIPSAYKPTSQDDAVNFQVMRLADVYLMAAEAENELNGPTNAWQYLAPVLNRVLPAAKVSALQTAYTASKEAFRKGIVDQRAFELGGEMIRKQDLIRWGILDEKLAETKTKLKALAERTGDYAWVPEKLYYKTTGEKIQFYGLNPGDTDDIGKTLVDNDGWTGKGWLVSNQENQLTDDIINGLYVVDKPSLHCVWPIPSTTVSSDVSGYLNNKYLGK